MDDGPVSTELEAWLARDEPKTIGNLVELFGPKSFALLLVLLLGLPALPLPTGGATHVFELIAMLLSLELIAGRDAVWLPQRWCRIDLAGPKQEKFLRGLMRFIRGLERFSKPRARWLFHRRASNVVFGLLTIALSVGAFLAPPFTALDTLPALGAVLIALGVLLEDVVVVIVGIVAGAAGVVLEIVIGTAAYHGLSDLF